MVENVLIITDNQAICEYLEHNAEKLRRLAAFSFAYTAGNDRLREKYWGSEDFAPVNVKNDVNLLKNNYGLIISWHCKQIFPTELFNATRCINIHPGYNPYNRGWFPQVFSIINKKPCGATIHEIDGELDHGAIIAQETVDIDEFDTSETAYKKIIAKEITLFEKNIVSVLEHSYSSCKMSSDGNLNTKNDFLKLCPIDMDKKVTVRECIDLLRALTFEGYDNAYFIDGKGNKIFISIKFNVEKKDRAGK